MPTTVINIGDAPAGWKNNPDYVYIGRGSVWGNPYAIGGRDPRKVDTHHMTREDVLELFKIRTLPVVVRNPQLVETLKGKTLVCFCKPQACHGDLLSEAVDKE